MSHDDFDDEFDADDFFEEDYYEELEDEIVDELDDLLDSLQKYLKLFPEIEGVTRAQIHEALPKHITALVWELEKLVE